MIKIITDSSSNIPLDLLEKYDITVLSFSMIKDGKQYLETSIKSSDLYDDIRKMKELVKFEAPSYETILAEFHKELQQGNTVVGIFMSSRAGEIVSRAKKAKDAVMQKYPKAHITIIDSLNICMALGLIVLAAAEANTTSAWIESVEEAASETVFKTKFFFAPKNLNNIAKRGEINKTKAALGNAIHLIPMLSTKHGIISPYEMVRTQSKAMERMMEILEDDIKKLGISKVLIAHINAYDEAKSFSGKVSEIAGIDVGISEISPVIGASFGPGTIGLIYCTRDMP